MLRAEHGNFFKKIFFIFQLARFLSTLAVIIKTKINKCSFLIGVLF